MKREVIYYTEETEEFSKAKIEPRVIDEKYHYQHNFLWNFLSLIIQNVLSMVIKLPYVFLKFRIKYVGKEKFKEYKNTGYFIYVNHTQEFADAFIPSLANYPKRNYFIVNPENISMKGLKHLVELLGAIPVPGTIKAAQNFNKSVKEHINKKYSITIYPEAHIWPYYTKIRNFSDVSFKYPIDLNVPVFCITNTYHERKKGKVKLISYIDGPFFPKEGMSSKEARKDLRNRVYECMVARSCQNTYEHIKYIKKG